MEFKSTKRHYCHGPKKLVAFRFHQPLLKELEKIAKENQNKSVTELVEFVLDQYVVFETSRKKRR